MDFTGERYMPEMSEEIDEISRFHFGRYVFADSFCKNKIVVDLACGSGYGSFYLAEKAKNVLGIDIDPEAIRYSKQHYIRDNLKFMVGSADNISFLDSNSIDVICSFETIEHLNEKQQQRFLYESFRVLKENGIFIISTPDKEIYGEHWNQFHIKELTKEEFLSFLSSKFREIEVFGQQKIKNKKKPLLERILRMFVKVDMFSLRKLFSKKFRRKIFAKASTGNFEKIVLPEKIENNETALYIVAVCKK